MPKAVKETTAQAVKQSLPTSSSSTASRTSPTALATASRDGRSTSRHVSASHQRTSTVAPAQTINWCMPEFTEDLWYLNDWSRRRIKDADEQWLASCKIAARQILGPGETLYEDSVGDNGHTTDVLNELVETIARRE